MVRLMSMFRDLPYNYLRFEVENLMSNKSRIVSEMQRISLYVLFMY